VSRPITPRPPAHPVTASCHAGPHKAPPTAPQPQVGVKDGMEPGRPGGVVLQPPEKFAPRPNRVDQVLPVYDPAFEAASVARQVTTTFHAGPKELTGRLEKLAHFEPRSNAFEAERSALTALQQGGAIGVADKVAQLENFLTVARLTPEGLARVEYELEVLRAVGGAFSAVKARVGALDGSEDPVDRIEASALRSIHGGYAGVPEKIASVEELMTRARFTPEGLRQVEAELTVLRALLGGVPQVTAKREALQELMTVALLSPGQSAKVQLEIAGLQRVEQAFAHFV
jgi:hypothetical protein